MNKSKFLKKSLAMILSVLMIVAMIPLGASAASNTTLQAIYINDVSVSVNNGVFAADVTDTTVKILVTGLYGEEEAYIDDVKVSGTANTVDLADYTPNSGVYTLPLVLTNDDATAEYSIKLTLVAKRTTTELASVKATKAFGATISGRNINVTVPRGYADDGVLTLTTKDGAEISTGTYVNGAYEVSGYGEGTEVLVVAESGGNKALYTVRLTERPILTAFQAGDVVATINNDNDKITATYPSTVLVTPPTEDNPPAAAMVTTFTVPAGTTVQFGDKAAISADLTTGVISTGKPQAYNDGAAFKAGLALKVTYEGVSNVYDIEFGTELDTANTIVSATVDGEAATISGTKITANVQKNASSAEVVLVGPAEAEMTVKDKAGTPVTITKGAPNGDGTANFTIDAADAPIATLKEGLIIVVTSQAGKNKQYELKVTATGDVDTTELTSFALLIGGEVYAGTVNKTARTVAVTVPYLTTDTALANAPIIATTNAYVKACEDETGDYPVTTAGSLNLAFNSNGTATGEVWAVAKSGSAPATKYIVTVKLDTAKTGNTLSSVVATSATKWKDLSNDNTYNGTVRTNADKSKAVVFKPAYSEGKAGVTTALYLKTLTTSNGGVAFLSTNGTTVTPVTGQLSDYYITKTVLDLDPDNGAPFVTMSSGDVTPETYIVVLPETEARKVLNGDPYDTSKGTTYQIVTERQAAKTGTSLQNVKFDTTTMGSSLTATIPYGLTNTIVFVDDFNVSTGATLGFADPDDIDDDLAPIIKGGAKDSDGNALDPSTTNGAFYFERQADGTVKVYAVTDKTNPTAKEATHLYVLAEDESNRQVYKIGTIKYALPNTEANITAFSLAGIAGKITSAGYDNWKIDVTVPLGTDVTILVPTFTASAGASVYTVDPKADPTATPIKSGEGSIDFSKPVTLTVVSEDGGKTNTYTVTVTVADSFSDVPTNAWFYNNVMAAYSAGYVSGNGDGTFAPNANVTRRDFAVMVWNMLGKPAPTTTVSFKDVRTEGYEVSAIAYLKEHDIVSGDADTGNFRPTATITRQEAACIIANAKDLVGTSATKFNDDAKIASWASAKVYACYAAGVLNGDKDTGNFRPTDAITRAEAATIVLQAASK